jgi:hypothetical protein
MKVKDFDLGWVRVIKEDESSTGRVWAAGFYHVMARSRLARVFKLMNNIFTLFL